MQKSILRGWQLYAGIICLSIVSISSCKKDDVTPTSATLRGTITVLNLDVWETWQDSGAVELSLFLPHSNDPPTGWGPFSDNAVGVGVPAGVYPVGSPVIALPYVFVDSLTEYNFEFELTNMDGPAEFSAMALGFRHYYEIDPRKRTAILGVYWDTPGSVSHGVVIREEIGGILIYNEPVPSTITLKPGDDLELNFRVDFDFVNDWYN